ncbi:MAG: hypothetical protein V4622_04900 [Bacteroidota bacterium]
MKSILKISFIFCSILALSFSCTIQKRTYNKGYFVQWNHISKSNEKEQIKTELSSKEQIQVEEEIIQEGNSNLELAQNVNSNTGISDVSSTETELEEKIKPNISPKTLLVKSLPKLNLEKKKTFLKKVKSKVKAPNLLDDLAKLYLVFALVFGILGFLFLLFALNSLAVAQIVYVIFCLLFFIISLSFVVLAFIFSEISTTYKNRKRR